MLPRIDTRRFDDDFDDGFDEKGMAAGLDTSGVNSGSRDVSPLAARGARTHHRNTDQYHHHQRGQPTRGMNDSINDIEQFCCDYQEDEDFFSNGHRSSHYTNKASNSVRPSPGKWTQPQTSRQNEQQPSPPLQITTTATTNINHQLREQQQQQITTNTITTTTGIESERGTTRPLEMGRKRKTSGIRSKRLFCCCCCWLPNDNDNDNRNNDYSNTASSSSASSSCCLPLQLCNCILCLMGVLCICSAVSQMVPTALGAFSLPSGTTINSIDIRLLVGVVNTFAGLFGGYCVSKGRGGAVLKPLYVLSAVFSLAGTVFYVHTTYRLIQAYHKLVRLNILTQQQQQQQQQQPASEAITNGFLTIMGIIQQHSSTRDYVKKTALSAGTTLACIVSSLAALLALLALERVLVPEPLLQRLLARDERHKLRCSKNRLAGIGAAKLVLGLSALTGALYLEYRHQNNQKQSLSHGPNDPRPLLLYQYQQHHYVQIALDNIAALLALASAFSDLHTAFDRAHTTVNLKASVALSLVAGVWCLKSVDNNAFPALDLDVVNYRVAQFFISNHEGPKTQLFDASLDRQLLTVAVHAGLLGVLTLLALVCGWSTLVALAYMRERMSIQRRQHLPPVAVVVSSSSVCTPRPQLKRSRAPSSTGDAVVMNRKRFDCCKSSARSSSLPCSNRSSSIGSVSDGLGEGREKRRRRRKRRRDAMGRGAEGESPCSARSFTQTLPSLSTGIQTESNNTISILNVKIRLLNALHLLWAVLFIALAVLGTWPGIPWAGDYIGADMFWMSGIALCAALIWPVVGGVNEAGNAGCDHRRWTLTTAVVAKFILNAIVVGVSVEKMGISISTLRQAIAHPDYNNRDVFDEHSQTGQIALYATQVFVLCCETVTAFGGTIIFGRLFGKKTSRNNNNNSNKDSNSKIERRSQLVPNNKNQGNRNYYENYQPENQNDRRPYYNYSQNQTNRGVCEEEEEGEEKNLPQLPGHMPSMLLWPGAVGPLLYGLVMCSCVVLFELVAQLDGGDGALGAVLTSAAPTTTAPLFHRLANGSVGLVVFIVQIGVFVRLNREQRTTKTRQQQGQQHSQHGGAGPIPVATTALITATILLQGILCALALFVIGPATTNLYHSKLIMEVYERRAGFATNPAGGALGADATGWHLQMLVVGATGAAVLVCVVQLLCGLVHILRASYALHKYQQTYRNNYLASTGGRHFGALPSNYCGDYYSRGVGGGPGYGCSPNPSTLGGVSLAASDWGGLDNHAYPYHNGYFPPDNRYRPYSTSSCSAYNNNNNNNNNNNHYWTGAGEGVVELNTNNSDQKKNNNNHPMLVAQQLQQQEQQQHSPSLHQFNIQPIEEQTLYWSADENPYIYKSTKRIFNRPVVAAPHSGQDPYI